MNTLASTASKVTENELAESVLDIPTALTNLQMDYAWKWFNFHADQRTKMFNFMLVTLGIIASTLVTANDKGLYFEATVLSWFAAGLTIAFLFLDHRNKRLYGVALDVLIELERKRVFGTEQMVPSFSNSKGPVHFQIAGRIKEEDKTDWWGMHVIGGKHRVFMPIIIASFTLLFLGSAFHSRALQQEAKSKPKEPTAAELYKLHLMAQTSTAPASPASAGSAPTTTPVAQSSTPIPVTSSTASAISTNATGAQR